ncbi:MAG: hypothetical protein NTW50_05295 [Candidatus Berkelbacteria bacterium]|nr:hypothetical protein [Candidatus Berkelbacteria bacterium]
MKKSCQNLTENLLEIQRKMSDFGEIKKQNLPQLLKLHAEICSLIEYGLSFKFDWSQYHSLEKSVKFYSNIQQPSVGFTQYPGAIVPKSGKFVNIMSDKIIDISSIKENGLELTAPREEYRIDFRNLDLGFDAGIRPELVFSPDGKEMVFYYGNGARGAYYIHNMETNQTEKWIEGGGSFFTILARLYFESRKKSFFLCENRLYCFSPRAILRYSASQIIRLPFVFISPRKIELSRFG